MKTIPLTRGVFALVDDATFAALGGFTWYAQRGWGDSLYAARRESRRDGARLIFMHRQLLEAKKGSYVDHRDGNTLNNQIHNLRICSNAQNGQHRVILPSNNTSGFIGVVKATAPNKWKAQIVVNRRLLYLGTFATIEEAAAARDKAALKFCGEFASTNGQIRQVEMEVREQSNPSTAGAMDGRGWGR